MRFRARGLFSDHRFMFTDIVGSTELVRSMGDEAWEAALRWHDETLRTLIGTHRGEVVHTTGDGFFASFPNAVAAVASAVAIQRRLSERRRKHGFAPPVRIGLHAAEATVHALRRLLKRSLAEEDEAADPLELQVAVHGALGLVLEQARGPGHPAVPLRDVACLEVLEGQPEGDEGGPRGIALGDVRDVRADECIEALPRMRVPPRRLAEALEIGAAEVALMVERRQRRICLRPVVLV